MWTLKYFSKEVYVSRNWDYSWQQQRESAIKQKTPALVKASDDSSISNILLQFHARSNLESRS